MHGIIQYPNSKSAVLVSRQTRRPVYPCLRMTNGFRNEQRPIISLLSWSFQYGEAVKVCLFYLVDEL